MATYKKARMTVWTSIYIVCLLPIVAYIVLQLPVTQTFIAHKVGQHISKQIDGKIGIEEVRIAFFNRVSIKNAYVVGLQNDTLGRIGKLNLSFSARNLLRGDLRINRLYIDGGSFNYITDKEGVNNLSDIFNLEKSGEGGPLNLPEFHIRHLDIKNFAFRYGSYEDFVPGHPECMDFSDMDISKIQIKLNEVGVDKHGTLRANIRQLSARDKSGWECRTLQAKYTQDRDGARLENLILADNYSRIFADYLHFNSKHFTDISDFLNKIIMEADFVDSYFDFRTLGKITESMRGNELGVYLHGRAYGPVSNLRFDNIKLSTETKESDLIVNGSLTELPSGLNLGIYIDEFRSNYLDLERSIADFSGKEIASNISDSLANMNLFYSGNLIGRLDSLNSTGELITPKGLINYDVNLSLASDSTKINANVATKELDLGAFLNTSSLGTATLNTSVTAVLAEDSGVKLDFKNTKISHLEFNDYAYSNIMVQGNYKSDIIDARIVSHDPNLSLIFQGQVGLNPDNRLLRAYVDIPYANLDTLNFIKTKSRQSLIRFNAIANLVCPDSTGIDYLGSVSIRDLNYQNVNGDYNIEDIKVTSDVSDDIYNVTLNSGPIDVKYQGEAALSNFLAMVQSELSYGRLPKTNSRLSVISKNTTKLFSVIMPQLYIADSTLVNLNFNENADKLFSAHSDKIIFKKNYINELDISLTKPDSALVLELKSPEMFVNNALIQDNIISTRTFNSKIDFHYEFQNSTDNNNFLDFNAGISFTPDSSDSTNMAHIDIKESVLNINEFEWNFRPSRIDIAKQFYNIKNFRIVGSSNEELRVDGMLTTNSRDALDIDLQNFDLSFLNSLISDDYKVSGKLSGDCEISNIFDSPSILMDIDASDLSFNENELGNLDVLTQWNEFGKYFDFSLVNRHNFRRPLELTGKYKPTGSEIELDVFLRDFNITPLSPILASTVSDLEGDISGRFFAKGSLENISTINSELELNKLRFTPNYTLVPYVVDGNIEIDQNRIRLNNISIIDAENNKGSLSGLIKHDVFRDIVLDTRLEFDELMFFNTSDSPGAQFYGDVYASGIVNLNGPINDLTVNANVLTEDGTEVHIPLSGTQASSNTDLLSFYSSADFFNRINNPTFEYKEEEKEDSNIKISGRVNITPDANLFIEINKELGDVIQCSGEGFVDLQIDPSIGLTELRGDYTISEGEYTFVLLGIASRNFTIDQGARISFNGDVANTTLDLTATYSTKASVSTLLGESAAVESRRDVDCKLSLEGSIDNPILAFDIEIPDLDPITKGKTESALSTEDKLQKQFMALLLSNSFMPDEQSGIFNNSTILYSNAGEIVANQFNNIFRQLGIPLDLGFNYQPGQDGQNDIFDVAVSYQAFNNRVLINGNVGTDQTGSDWMGNFEAQVKIDKQGKFRSKLFTRAADDYSNYIDDTQRSGIGISYQDEFDTISDLFRNLFRSRKKEEEEELKIMQEIKEELLKQEELKKVNL